MDRETKTILLVEDEAPARAALQDLMEAHGYHVVAAGGGIEALILLRDNPPPDLIVSDLVMGLMSGWELNERQQVDFRLQNVPVVLVSGVPDLQQHAEALGAAAYFGKPVEAGELLAAIDRILFREPAMA
jgi:CheY-like chemotaxis protein